MFLLAQAGEAGATAANHIVAKILKKKADREVVYTWSKFLHSCCLHARHTTTTTQQTHSHIQPQNNYSSDSISSNVKLPFW